MEGFKLVAAILPTGSTCKVLDAAREAWAEGGTILLARGTGVHEARRFFGLSVSSEREVLLIWWNGKRRGRCWTPWWAPGGSTSPRGV